MYISVDKVPMNDITLTALRKKLFRVADRGGRVLTLSADAPRKPAGRLARLKRRNVVAGDPSTLWKVKAAKWRGHGSRG
jgi:hypothetical protein